MLKENKNVLINEKIELNFVIEIIVKQMQEKRMKRLVFDLKKD